MKNALRHRFDTGEDFENLLRAARRVECESAPLAVAPHSNPRKNVSSHSQVVPSDQETKLDFLIKELEQMKVQLKSLTSNKKAQKTSQRDTGDRKCFYCQSPSHLISSCTKFHENNRNQAVVPKTSPEQLGNGM